MDDPDGTLRWLVGLGAWILAVAAALTRVVLQRYSETRARMVAKGTGLSARTAQRLVLQGDAIDARLRAVVVLGLLAAVLAAAQPIDAQQWLESGTLTLLVGLSFVFVVELGTVMVAPRASRLGLTMLRVLRPVELLVTPLVAPVVWAGRWIAARLVPPPPEPDSEQIAAAEVERLIEQGEEEGAISEDHAELLRSALEFKDTVTREVMVPRTRVVAIDATMSVADVLKVVTQSGHSRYPVCRGGLDRVEGILYAKDLFRALQSANPPSTSVGRLVRVPVPLFAESQKISSVLRDMQRRRVHMGVVVDEFGGTSGIVTLEDIVEEIVGEIHDEHEPMLPQVIRLSDRRYLVDAGMSVHDLASALGVTLPTSDGDYESLGGLLTAQAGRVPRVGDGVPVGELECIVREGDARRVVRVEVVLPGADRNSLTALAG